MILPEKDGLPKDPERLLREVDAAIKAKDIGTVYRYRDQLEVKWWESGIIILLFVSGLGFMVTIYKLIPADKSVLFWFIFFWFALFTLTIVATLEFLYLKICALRRLYEINSRILEHLEKQVNVPPSN